MKIIVFLCICRSFTAWKSITILRQAFRRIFMSGNGSGDHGGTGAVADTINKLINDHKVVVFSKTYCKFSVEYLWVDIHVRLFQGPYCVKAKRVLGKYNIKDYKILELDDMDDGNEYQTILGKMTGARTVPRVFIGGKCIGGGDDTERLDKKGELQTQLKEINAIEN